MFVSACARLFNIVLHNRADTVLIKLSLTLLYMAIREKDVNEGKGEAGLRMDGLESVSNLLWQL